MSQADELRWQSSDPITATAREVNIDSQSQWQNALTGAAIGFGIGGSLLAALLFEMLVRRRQPSTFSVLPPGPAAMVAHSAPSEEAAAFQPVRSAVTAPAAGQSGRVGAVLLATVGLVVGFLLGARTTNRK